MAESWRVSAIAAFCCALLATRAMGEGVPTIEVRNARWFDGQSFAPKTFYAVEGILTSSRPRTVDVVLDYADAFIVPPFGEAHNHNASPAQLARYVDEGIFYVKNPNNLPGLRGQLAGSINTETTVDVVFANGGLTSPGGHPILVVERDIARGGMTEKDGDNAFYHAIRDRNDLEHRWPGVLSAKPDFLKVYLLYSERFSERRDLPAARGWRGLDPELLPDVVRRAHGAGLRVSAHVESAADLALAVDAGIDEVNHLPGFRGPAPDMPLDVRVYAIDEDLARRAAARGVVVVTTVSGVEEIDPTGPMASLRKEAEALYRRSLQRLHEAGVPLAIGSDRFRETSRAEARYIQTLGVFDNLTLLKMWCETTPATIFPGRRIGRLADGYEASFLALDGNPIEDFGAVTRIRARVKQGRALR